MDIGTLVGQIQIEDQLSSVVDYATNVIKTFAGELGKLPFLSGSAGLALGAIAGAATAVAAAIGTVTASIIALGNRGSDVNDVADTFEHFSGSVDTAADSLKQMQEGTKGTVTNFDLMKNASKLLAGDVKLTSDQFGVLTKAAFVLQNQGLGGTKEMLDLVSQAMLTGQTRMLRRAVGVIDLTKAEKDLASKLGTTRDNLTQMGKVEAARIGILDALNKKVKEAGEQQRDFGETMDAAVVFIKNWGDELSSRVAESPRVMAAVHAIEDAIKQAFGSETQSVLELVVKGIERFADEVRVQGPIIIQWISDAIQTTKEWLDWLERVQRTMQFLTPGSSTALSGAVGAGQEAAANVRSGMRRFLDPRSLSGANLGAGLVDDGSLSGANLGAGLVDDGSFTFMPPTTINNPSQEARRNLVDFNDQKKKDITTTADMIKRIQSEEKAYFSNMIALKKVTLSMQDDIEKKRQALTVYPKLAENYGYVTQAIKDERTGVERLNDSLNRSARLQGQEFKQAQEQIHEVITTSAELLEREAVAMEKGLEFGSRLAQSIIGAFQGGGNVGKTIGSFIGNEIGKYVGESIGKAIGGKLGGAVGGIFGPLGALAGSLFGSLIDKLFGPTDYEKRVRQAAADMKSLTAEAVKAAGSMQRLALNASMVGINIQGAFDSKDPEFLKQVLDEMTTKTQKLDAAMKEYGFTWEDMGEKFRAAKLGDQFDALYEKTQLLKGAGIDYNEILKRQADQYVSLVEAAVRTGTEIPAAMRPVLEDLLEMGILTGDAATKFERELGEVSWSQTMTQGFRDVTTAIYELRDGLLYGVGGAIDSISGREIVIKTRVDRSGIDSANLEVQQPAYMHSGGVVVPFTPRGSDTVPAMLTPGERVVPRGGGGGTVIVELDRRWLAEAVVPEIPGAVKRMGIR